MRTDEFVMRGQTASSGSETLNFSGLKPGYAYRLIEFKIAPSTDVMLSQAELTATITAATSAEDPVNPNYNNEGLIGHAMFSTYTSNIFVSFESIINDTFLITQDLILAVRDTSNSNPVNWQCRFKPVKMGKAEGAVTNYKQFTISDQ